MRIVVSQSVEIIDADNLREFDVKTTLPAEEVDARLREAGLGRLTGEHAWIDIAALRRHASAESTAPDWEASFEGMIAYARSKGWCDESTGAVRAHLTEA